MDDSGRCSSEPTMTSMHPSRQRRSTDVVRRILDENCYVYLCGLKDMEHGVDEALRDACRSEGQDWDLLLPRLRQQGRYHVETY